MDFEDTLRPGTLGYDERTETWFVRSRDAQRLMLTRRSLARLVEMYNSVHTGRPLSLVERKELESLEVAQLRQAEFLRQLRLERARQARPLAVLRRFFARLARRRGLSPRR